VIACAFFSSLTLSETSFSFFNRSKMKVEELFEEYSSAGFETEEFEVLESDNSGGKD
jgi:shikimate kinase